MPGPLWAQLGAAAGPVGIAIVNPHNGPGGDLLAAYVAQIRRSRARGIAVLGYVDTDYARRPAGDVRRDIVAYATRCDLDGIFLDQVSVSRSDGPYYAEIAAAIKAEPAAAMAVLNPGLPPPEAFMAFADIVVTFENTVRRLSNCVHRCAVDAPLSAGAVLAPYPQYADGQGDAARDHPEQTPPRALALRHIRYALQSVVRPPH